MSYAKAERELLSYGKKHGSEVVDLRFTDPFGTWQHFTSTWREFKENISDGLGYDASSILGFQKINESDMILKIDAKAPYFMDPFTEHKTLVVFGYSFDPVKNKPYGRDPRNIASAAERYLRSTQIGDRAYFGPEAEFFIFDSVKFQKNGQALPIVVESEELTPTDGYPAKTKRAYFPVVTDRLQDIRTAIMLDLENAGIPIEVHHHEVGKAQNEIDMKRQPLLRMADQVQVYKYFVTKEARRRGKTATFLPKVFSDDNGSGMHVHQSIWRGNTNVFAGKEYAGLSREALYYIGGLLEHADALAAIFAPTFYSYNRLVPGFEAPNLKGYSMRNRSALCRIPMYSTNPRTKRVEFRAPDPTSNPYLTFAGLLLAGLDGIRRRIDPGKPVDHDFYELTPQEKKQFGVDTLPGSLDRALKALERDHKFLTEKGVFSEDFLAMYAAVKAEEIKRAKQDPVKAMEEAYSYGV